MASEAKQIKQGIKNLHRLQDKQAKSIKRVGNLRNKLDKASRKMQALETKAAQLEQRVYQLRNPGGRPIPQFAKGLRPARLIVNAKGGGFAERVQSPEKLVDLLRAHGIQAEVYLKTTSKAVRRWVREAVDNNEELVIAVGGDGTIEDVALPLMGSDTVLGIIPVGTMNNLAHELGIPLDIEQACALIGAGITRQIDVGCVHSTDPDKRTYFMEAAGLGMAIALPVGQAAKKGRWGKLPAALQKLFAQKPGPVEVELDSGESFTVNSQLVTVSNAPLYAMNNLIAPDAKMDDGLLDVAVYEGMSDVDLADHFQKTLKGRRVDNPNVRFYRTHHVHIRTNHAVPDVSDKDELPAQEELEFEVVPRAINVIVGQGHGLTWPVDAVPAVPPLVGEQSAPKPDSNTPVETSLYGTHPESLEAPSQELESAVAESK